MVIISFLSFLKKVTAVDDECLFMLTLLKLKIVSGFNVNASGEQEKGRVSVIKNCYFTTFLHQRDDVLSQAIECY